MRGLLAASVFCALSAPGVVLAADAAFTSGGWQGDVYGNDQTGHFEGCRASTVLAKGTRLAMGYSRDANWTLSLENSKWNLPEGRHYPIHLSIDGSPVLDLESTAVSNRVLQIPLAQDKTLATLLRRGHSLRMLSGTFDESYDLAGTADVMSRLGQCVQDQLKVEAQDQANATAAREFGYSASVVGLALYALPLGPVLGLGAAVAQLETASPTTSQAAQKPPDVAPVHSAKNPPATPFGRVAENVAGSANIAKPRIEVAMQAQGGIFVVPVLINGVITLDFIIDSGASDVSIPADVVLTLVRAGTIKDSDFLGEQDFVLADGSHSPAKTFRIRSLKIGDTELRDLTGSVAPTEGDLLLGQSFLSKFKSWSMDNRRHVLMLEPE